MRSKKAALWQKLAKKATLQKKDNKTKEQNPGNETDCQKQEMENILHCWNIETTLNPLQKKQFLSFQGKKRNHLE